MHPSTELRASGLLPGAIAGTIAPCAPHRKRLAAARTSPLQAVCAWNGAHRCRACTAPGREKLLHWVVDPGFLEANALQPGDVARFLNT